MPSSKIKDISNLNNRKSLLTTELPDINPNVSTRATPAIFEASPVIQDIISTCENMETPTGTPAKAKKLLKPIGIVNLSSSSNKKKSSAPTRLWIRRFLVKFSFIRVIIEIILSNILAVIAAPFIISALLLIILARGIVSLCLHLRYKGNVSLMAGADAAWAVQSYAHDNCFVSLYVLQGDCDLSKIRKRMLTSILERKVENNNNELVYKRLRQKIVQKFGFFCWQDVPHFSVEDHVKFITNDAQAEMTEQQVFAEIQSWIDTPLGNDLPQWQMLVVPKFIYKNNTHKIYNQERSFPENHKGNYALVWRMNHAIIDGISASNCLQHCIADAPVRLTVDPLEPLNIPFYVHLFIYMKMLVFGPRSFIRSMILDDSNCFHGPTLTGPKRLYWSRPISVEALKSIKNATRTSTTAVLTSCVGGSLRNLAYKKNLQVPDKITAGTTVALLPYPNINPQNRFTVAHIPIVLGGLESLGERLEYAYKSAKELAGSSDVLKNFHLIRLTGLCPVTLIKSLMNNCQATMLLSNIPGPAEYYHLFEGDKLVDATAWNTIKGKTGIGMCLFSYAGRVRAGFIADGAVLPDASDVLQLVEEFENELKELAVYTGIPFNALFTSY